MLLAGVGEEAARSAGTEVGGYFGATRGLIGGVSTGGVALEEYRWERRSSGASLLRRTSDCGGGISFGVRVVA